MPAFHNHLLAVRRDSATDIMSHHNRWRESKNSWVCSVQVPQGNRLAPVLSMKDRRCRILEIRGYFYRFPRQVMKVWEVMGEEGKTALHNLEVELRRCSWDTIDENRVFDAIHFIPTSVSNASNVNKILGCPSRPNRDHWSL